MRQGPRRTAPRRGLLPPLLEEIFEPFKRGDVSATPGGGVGLGLYIVKEIALAHGGTVAVHSEEGAGTTFTVNLPRRWGAGSS